MIDAGDASEGKTRQHSSTMDSAMFPSDRCPKTLETQEVYYAHRTTGESL